MLQKIRLRAAGELPEDYCSYMGGGFDGRCVRFLGVDYNELVRRTLQGGEDEEVLEWCFASGRTPSEEETLIWNEFMIKRGWRDTGAASRELQEYKEQYGLGHRDDILTYFDFLEIDEGRSP